MIKFAGTMFSPFLISALRFAIGICLLLIILRKKTGHLRLSLTGGILIAGGI